MKKSELKQIIKEEIQNILKEGGPLDALGSVYGAFQTQKTNKQDNNTPSEGFVITNNEEYYAGAKNYIKFTKHKSQSNLYPTYASAQLTLFNEIPEEISISKKLKVKRFK